MLVSLDKLDTFYSYDIMNPKQIWGGTLNNRNRTRKIYEMNTESLIICDGP